MIRPLGFGDVDLAARHVYLDVGNRYAMILAEYHLRVMRPPGVFHHFLHEILRHRAQALIDLDMTGGNGNAHRISPLPLLHVHGTLAPDVLRCGGQPHPRTIPWQSCARSDRAVPLRPDSPPARACARPTRASHHAGPSTP